LTWSASRWGLLLAGAWLVLALHGLGAADIVGDDEAREAGIVQDVVAGHWLLPRFNDQLLPDKPILYHWLAAAPCALAGFSETAVRLPSALAGAALVWWTTTFGAALFGRTAGVVAGILLATTPTFLDHARVARPDVLLALLLALALGAAFRWWRDGARRDAAWALAWVGAGVLAKGPVAPALSGATLVAFLAWQRQLRRLPGLLTVPGVAAALVLGLGWYAVALAGWGGRFVHEHLVGRYVGNVVGGLMVGKAYSQRSVLYHLLFYPKHLLVVALPWTPLVAVAVWQLWRAGRVRDPRARFLVCWALAPVVVFTPAQWKLRYYLLPSLPALACLAAPVVTALLAAPLPKTGRVPRAVAALVVAALVVAAGWLALTHADRFADADRAVLASLATVAATSSAAALLGFGLGVAVVTVALFAWPGLVAVTAAAVVAWSAIGLPAMEQATSRRDSLRPFAEAARAAALPLAFYGPTVRPIVVYVGHPIPTLHRKPDALLPHTLVIATEPDYHSLVEHARLGPPLAIATGRASNLTSTRLVLAETRQPKPRTDPADGAGPGAPAARL